MKAIKIREFKKMIMKKYFKLAILCVLSSLFFVQCRKSEIELVGSASSAEFSFIQSTASDTLPYPYNVNFTNSSKEAFLYQWNFGDNSAFSAEKNPIHTYKVGGTYNVTLTSVGTFGNNSVTKVLSVLDACQNDFFNKLTNCTYGEWTWSTDDDAIKVLYADGTSVYSYTSAADCQIDDVFKFNVNGDFGYEANDQTYIQSTSICGPAKANASSYQVVAPNGYYPKIILGALASGIGRPFLGTTDSVENNTYEVLSFTQNSMLVRATLSNSGGKFVQIKLVKKTILTLDGIKQILTGGSSRSWKLDPTTGANSIVVGTEGNPTEYYGGGPLEPTCQVDDVYSFSINDHLIYNANGSTFNGGNIAPNYNCGADRSFEKTYVFGAVVGGLDGLAQIQLELAPPASFIGTTDVPAENYYRIMEITPTKMLLRAGSGAGVVFQFKFVRQ